uniref:Mannose receptor, C type 1b n=1 Tax=Sander lucioperca TaxID=283035 RepID=A0A8D0CPC0_SANLU
VRLCRCALFWPLPYVSACHLDSPFQLTNKDTGFCLVKTNINCNDLRWTTGDRLLVEQRIKCLGVQGKSVGSELSLYECDENSDLQKWECKNGTVLALKDQELYIELTADNTAVLSKTIGPNNHLTISGTSSGACARTYRELYAIGGNAAGLPCMFPFQYKDKWYSHCTTVGQNLWCAVETKYQSERWGYCPVTCEYSKEGWTIHPTTGAYYQLNTQAALTWPQAEASCKQQGSSLLSITDPHQQAYVTALLGTGGNKLWTGLILDPEHGWKWSNGRPFRYLKWDSGHPLPDPGQNCATVDPAVQYSWQSSTCSKKLGYICYSKAAEVLPTTAFCSRPWIPYNGHCFHLNRTQKTWDDAQRECRNEGGDLVSIHNVEDQSFVISQLGYTSTDELWIGLNDKKMEGLFDWIDHSTVSFTSWEFGTPAVSTDIKDCVLIRGENGNWADRVCEEKHGSICMKMSASKSTGDEVEQDLGCKTGWRRHGSYCYFIGIETKTFDEAKNECESSDSYLADVSNRVDNAFLVSLVGMRPEKYFWLGLSNQKDIDQFVWTNTDSVRFTHWNAEMPGHRQGCVAMTTGVFAGLWDVLSCTNKEKYICKHLAEGAVLTPAPPTFTPATCADGWTRIGSRRYCYKVFSESSSNKRTWYEARDYCRAIGGDLLSIHSADEREKLPQRYGSFWIGLSAPDPDTGYVWSDGSPLQFQHWSDGEPNNKNNVESCVESGMNSGHSSGSWNDLHCETYRGWLCQIRIGVTPKPPPDPETPDYNKTSDGWLEWNGTQYYINKMPMAMEEARRFCQQRHSDLVTINSEAESVFLWKQVMVFTRWDENQPVFLRNDENCAVMTTSMGFWHDYNCGYEHKSICKRSGSPPANATVAPTVSPKGGCPQNWEKLASKVRNPSLPDSPEPTTSTDYVKILNDSIKVVTQQMDWDEAKKHCEGDGAKLASLRNEWSQAYVELLVLKLNAPLWIGLNKMEVQGRKPLKLKMLTLDIVITQKETVERKILNFNLSLGIWKWLDKTTMDYTNWSEGQPGGNSYGLITITNGKWSTGQHWYDRGYVCKTPKGEIIILIRTQFELTLLPPTVDPQTRGHIILAVVLAITVIAIVIALFLFKKSGLRLPIPERLSTFDNPLFFNNERSQPDLVDTNKLVANAEEENSGSVITV